MLVFSQYWVKNKNVSVARKKKENGSRHGQTAGAKVPKKPPHEKRKKGHHSTTIRKMGGGPSGREKRGEEVTKSDHHP